MLSILFWEGLSFELTQVEDEEIEEVKIESTDGEKHVSSRSSSEDEEEEGELTRNSNGKGFVLS